ERHLDLRRVDPPSLRAPETAQPAEPAAGLSTAGKEPEEADEEQGGAEPEQELAPQRGAGVRVLGVDLDALALKQRGQRDVVPERGDPGREQRRWLGLRAPGRVNHL